MVPLLLATVLLAAPQTFDGLTIDLPAQATEVQGLEGRRVWEAAEVQTFANGQKQENHKVTVAITDFGALESKPTADQLLALHEENLRRRAGYSNVFARRSEGKAGNLKAIMFYGYGRDEKGNGKTLASAVIAEGLKLYEVIWVTDSFRRDIPLKSIAAIKFDGAPVTGWKATTEGEYSMNGFPFAATSKLFIGTEMVKPERGYADGYMASTLTGGDAIVDTRFIAVRLKPGDSRTDKQILKDLAGMASSPFTSEEKIPAIVGGSLDKTAEFQDVFGSTIAARAVYLRKGDYVGFLSVTGEKSAAVLEELKKPALRYLKPD